MSTLNIKIDSCSYTSIIPLANKLRHLDGVDKVVFDLNELDFFKPAGMIFICSMIETCHKKGKDVSFSYDKMHSKVKGYGEWIGFFEVANIREGRGAMSGDTYLSLAKENVKDFFTQSSPTTQRIEYRLEQLSLEIVSLLTRNSPIKNQGSAKKNLTYAMREIFRNIFDHSRSTDFWYAGQYYPYDGYVEITIGDNGVGLRDTIPFDIEDIWFNRNTDKKAIELALLAGVSAFSNHAYAPEDFKNSGFGLNMVKKFCEFAEGSFLIATGETAIHYTKDFNEVINTYYEGTFIRLRLNTNKMSNIRFEEVMLSAVRDAEKAGRSTKPSSASTKVSLRDNI
ncbi:sensor histidine kinase [Priestia megaterium]|uniref:sensor histidine kinase n=1 Tax=Priestia megaterium TaxID=1404 RepID=UPI000BFD97F7|nr:sensor histidine kinase [Priestia megaterium]PGR79737.1 hypothetical protein COC53_26445 [Priestia megaterium]